MRLIFIFAFAIAVPLLLFSLAGFGNDGDSETGYVRGVVYNDANRNQVRDDDEVGVPDVCVSNGLEVVKTGKDGRYELPVDDDAIILVIKPADWKIPVDESCLPRFYYIHKPDGSPGSKYAGVAPTGPLPGSVDFPLYHEEEPERYRAILFGDTQPRDRREVCYIAHDVVEELMGVDAEFGVTLGDVVFDDLSIFDPLNSLVAQMGIPWYNVHGNHDINRDSPDDEYSDETFERIYGPSHYAFNYGPVHFIVLDNIAWEGNGYHGEIGETQLRFVQNDLELVPEDKLVVLMMHIPLIKVENYRELFDVIEHRPYTLSIAAHWHQQRHIFFGGLSGWDGDGKHHHLVQGTVCGSWWQGAPDEYGIPHAMMSDGTPNGYSFITFDGNQYAIEYKVARSPASYQMNIFAPDEVASQDAAGTDVVVNVFAGSMKSIVEMKFGEDGEWVRMKQSEMLDPYVERINQEEQAQMPQGFRAMPKASLSGHIWRARLPVNPSPGTYTIHIRTTDMFGHEYKDCRIIRII